jgi:phosphatidylserine decarboxylase
MNYPYPLIAKEGWPFIAIAALIAFLVQGLFGPGIAVPFWLAFFLRAPFFT